MSNHTILNQDAQHGSMESVGDVSQAIKDALRAGKNWPMLTPGEREALEMIAHKIGGITSGSFPYSQDCWINIAVYAMAAKQQDMPSDDDDDDIELVYP